MPSFNPGFKCWGIQWIKKQQEIMVRESLPLLRDTLTWLELSDRELRSERRRVTMTEGLWSVRFGSLCLWGQLDDREVCSWSKKAGSARRTGTDTGITRGTRLSSRTRLALKPSISPTPRPGPDAGGLQDL